MYQPRGLIGVVHLPAMPGDPGYRSGGFAGVLAQARRDAQAWAQGGADALIVENFGSAPFPKGDADQPTPTEQVAMLALAVRECLDVGLPVGVNVLRNDADAALGIAAATGAAFIRVNVHVGAYVTDQGLIEGRAFATLRKRQQLGCDIAILADVRVKHATPLAEVPLVTEVEDVLHRGHADAVVVTGAGTGKPIDTGLLRTVRTAAHEAPVVLGSGVNPTNAATLAPQAEAAIVGSWCKVNGDVALPVDVDRVRTLAGALRFR